MYMNIYIMGNIQWLRELSVLHFLQKDHFPTNNYTHWFAFLLHYFLFHLNTFNPLVNIYRRLLAKNSLHPKIS